MTLRKRMNSCWRWRFIHWPMTLPSNTSSAAAAFAIAAPVQWLAVGGGPAQVRATTRSATSGRGGGMRAGRVLSRQSPVTPSSPNRSCQPPDHRLGLAGGAHDVGSAMTIGRQKHNLRPPNVLLRAVAVGRHRPKLAAVGGTQSNVASLVHSSDSHTRVHQRMPKRIEMSDLVHSHDC